MSKKLFACLAVAALFAWTLEPEVDAKQHTDCEDGTLIYWQEQHTWICEPGDEAGPACILCYGEPIDVVG